MQEARENTDCFFLKVKIINSHVYIITSNWKLKILRGELNIVCGVSCKERWHSSF